MCIYIYVCTGEKKRPKTDADDQNADGVQHWTNLYKTVDV